jgi:hypothetical protein
VGIFERNRRLDPASTDVGSIAQPIGLSLRKQHPIAQFFAHEAANDWLR